MSKNMEDVVKLIHEASALVEKHNTNALKAEDVDGEIDKLRDILGPKAKAEAKADDDNDGKFGKKR